MNYILNGEQIENMATQLNKANRTAIRQCECEKIAAENKRLKEAPIQILVKGDQMWIAFDAGDHRHAMINLNEIVRNKPDFGITKGICLDAMHKVLEVEN